MQFVESLDRGRLRHPYDDEKSSSVGCWYDGMHDEVAQSSVGRVSEGETDRLRDLGAQLLLLMTFFRSRSSSYSI